MNYKLKPGDTAEIAQADGKTLTIRAHDHFTMVYAARIRTTLKTDMDTHFIMAVKVVEKEEEEPTRKTPQRKPVRVRADDDMVELMRVEFPDRVGTARIMDFAGTAVLGVEININGLTHSELMSAGMSYDESAHLLGK